MTGGMSRRYPEVIRKAGAGVRSVKKVTRKCLLCL